MRSHCRTTCTLAADPSSPVTAARAFFHSRRPTPPYDSLRQERRPAGTTRSAVTAAYGPLRRPLPLTPFSRGPHTPPLPTLLLLSKKPVPAVHRPENAFSQQAFSHPLWRAPRHEQCGQVVPQGDVSAAARVAGHWLVRAGLSQYERKPGPQRMSLHGHTGAGPVVSCAHPPAIASMFCVWRHPTPHAAP